MIRPFTLVTLLLACSSGAWMFVVKHRADAIEQKLGDVTGQIRSAERQIRVLKAEWALQTDPNRLAWLAQIFMPELHPMAPDQLVTWKQLAARLPPPGSAAPSLPLPPPLPPGLVAQSDDASGTPPQATPSNGAPVASKQDQDAAVRTVAMNTAPPAHHHNAATHNAVSHNDASRRAETTHKVAATQQPHHRRHVHHTPPHVAYHAPIGASVLAVRAEPLPPPSPRPRPAPQPRSQPTRSWQAQARQTQPRHTPVREASATEAPAHRQTASSSSVFGGLGANLPPPRPIGNTPH